MQASLTNLTPRRLIVVAFAAALTNSTLHRLWFALTGTMHPAGYSTTFVGDLPGAITLLYVVKGPTLCCADMRVSLRE